MQDGWSTRDGSKNDSPGVAERQVSSRPVDAAGCGSMRCSFEEGVSGALVAGDDRCESTVDVGVVVVAAGGGEPAR